jgi:dephospho-CoA kinase
MKSSIRQPDAIVLSDIPLLIENGAQDRVDMVLLVYISIDEQMERLIQRNGYSREYAEKRISSQMPIEKKVQYARIVINNQGSLDQAKVRVENVWQELIRYEQKKRENNSLE